MNTQTLYNFLTFNKMKKKTDSFKNTRTESGFYNLIRFVVITGVFALFNLLYIVQNVNAQAAQANPMVQSTEYTQHSSNIFNYTTTYNSGKVFVNWTAKDEPLDCIYIIERSSDGKMFESVGVKEGIGTNLELFYSWMDHTPPSGFAYYRVKKITKDGTQLFSSTNTIINQGSSFDNQSNYAKGGKRNKFK